MVTDGDVAQENSTRWKFKTNTVVLAMLMARKLSRLTGTGGRLVDRSRASSPRASSLTQSVPDRESGSLSPAPPAPACAVGKKKRGPEGPARRGLLGAWAPAP